MGRAKPKGLHGFLRTSTQRPTIWRSATAPTSRVQSPRLPNHRSELRVVKVEPPPAMVAPKPRGTVAQQPAAAQQQDWLGSDDEVAVAAALETAQGLSD